jgi:hypothetical protein
VCIEYASWGSIPVLWKKLNGCILAILKVRVSRNQERLGKTELEHRSDRTKMFNDGDDGLFGS